MTFALLSRRSRNRVGTRYIVRGADQHGNVANEVETEQLVVADDGRATAYVLLRGSIPLRWCVAVCFAVVAQHIVVRRSSSQDAATGRELQAQATPDGR